MATRSTHHHVGTLPVHSSIGKAPLPVAISVVWSHAWARLAAAVTIAGASGLVMALVMPRGPVTSVQALSLMATGLITGIVAGFVLRSRWAMVVAPLAHIAVFELGRISESGPTVDGINFTTTYGILGFVVGRGVYGFLAVFPMILGVAYGADLARRLVPAAQRPSAEWHRPGAIVRRATASIATIGMIALAVWIAIPASVAPVTGPNGEPIEGSVAELTSIDIDGNQQWLEIRGASPDLPILLYISGGPGQSDLAFSRALLDDLTQDFLVVGWDQRGNGLSYADWDASAMTLDRAIADTVDVTNYLRERFEEEKIYILGESWGTTLGVLTIQQHPELFHAFIGSGQMVSQRETDLMIYHDLVAWAKEHSDTGLLDTLKDFGPPPYASVWEYGFILQNYPKLEGDYDPPQAYIDRGESAGVGFWGMMGSEYTPINKVNIFRGLIDAFDVMYPQLQGIDFRTDVPALEVPVYILDGEHELRGRRELSHAWFAMLDAPEKHMYTFEDGGHSIAFEHFEDLHRILIEEVLPTTYPGYES